MMVALAYLVVAVLILLGIAVLARPRTISEEEYEELREKGNPLGNALLEAQAFVDPGAASLREAASQAVQERDDEGDLPSPGADRETAPGRGEPGTRRRP